MSSNLYNECLQYVARGRLDRLGNDIPGYSDKLQRKGRSPTKVKRNKSGEDPESPDRKGKATPQHQITFRDKAEKGQRVCDVYLVESYKKYNAMEIEDDTVICKCTIF